MAIKLFRNRALMPTLGSMFKSYHSPQQENPRIDPRDLPARSGRFSPTSIMLWGRRDMGKSMTLTAIAYVMKEKLHQEMPFVKLATNYSVSFSDIQHPEILHEIRTMPEWAHDLYLCIDEIQEAAVSRRAMSGAVVELGSFLRMIRKRRIEPSFTTQFPQQIDSYVLMQTDLFVLAEKCYGGRAVRLYAYDWWGQFTGDMRKKYWPPAKEDADASMILWHTDTVWDMYNTDQVIASEFMSAEERQRITDAEWRPEDMREYFEDLTPAMEEAQGDAPVVLQKRQKAKVQASFIEALPEAFEIKGALEAAISAGIIKKRSKKPMEDFQKWLEETGFSIRHSKGKIYAEKEKR